MLGIAISPETHEPVGWDRWTVNGLEHVSTGMLLGLPLGWFIIKPVNAVLAFLLPRLQLVLRARDDGLRLDHRHGDAARRLVLLSLRRPPGSHLRRVREPPTGFVPQQDMGRSSSGVQLPDSASLERSEERRPFRSTEITRAEPGVNATVTMCGISFVQQASSPNFASLFVILKPFKDRQKPEAQGRGDHGQAPQTLEGRGERRPRRSRSPRRRSRVSASPAASRFSSRTRPVSGSTLLQKQTDALVRKLKDEPGLASMSTELRPRRRSITWTSIKAKVAALGCGSDDVNETVVSSSGLRTSTATTNSAGSGR